MTYGIIDRKNHKYYTYMSKVFQAMDNAQLQYNWLITGCICYPQNNDIEKLLDQEYCWLTGDELSAIIEQEDFQWIWGCLCGFSKDITMEEALKYPNRRIPYANPNRFVTTELFGFVFYFDYPY